MTRREQAFMYIGLAAGDLAPKTVRLFYMLIGHEDTKPDGFGPWFAFVFLACVALGMWNRATLSRELQGRGKP